MERVVRAVWLVLCLIAIAGVSYGGSGRVPPNSKIHILAAQGISEEAPRQSPKSFLGTGVSVNPSTEVSESKPLVISKSVQKSKHWLSIAVALVLTSGFVVWRRRSAGTVVLEEW